MELIKHKYLFVLFFIISNIALFFTAFAVDHKSRECLSKRNDLAVDSVALMLRDGQLHHDSLLLIKAIELSDRILSDSENLTQNQKFRCYYHRALIFATLGRMDEAYENREKTALCMNQNNPERLLYYGYKYKMTNNQDSSKFYIDKLVTVCDNLLVEDFNSNIVFYKVRAIYLRDGEIEAKSYLKKMCKEHPKDELLRIIKNNWDAYLNVFLSNTVVDLSSF